MRLRALAAALAAVPLALAGCAETARHAPQTVVTDPRPPIEELCSDGHHCLSRYYMFSSEAFGTGGLAEYYRRLESDERFYRSENPERCRIHGSMIGGGYICKTFGEAAESAKNQREALQDFVARWLAAYPSAREGYLALAAAALDRAWEVYCSDLPLRALDAERDAERVGETWYEMADRLGPEAADRAQRAGELLPEPDFQRKMREWLAQRIEGRGGYALPLIAPGHENAGEPLLTAMSCEGGEGGEG